MHTRVVAFYILSVCKQCLVQSDSWLSGTYLGRLWPQPPHSFHVANNLGTTAVILQKSSRSVGSCPCHIFCLLGISFECLRVENKSWLAEVFFWSFRTGTEKTFELWVSRWLFCLLPLFYNTWHHGKVRTSMKQDFYIAMFITFKWKIFLFYIVHLIFCQNASFSVIVRRYYV